MKALPLSTQCERTREFVRLLTDHQGVLRGFLLSRMPNHPDVRDLLQEINIVLWENMDSFEQGTDFRAWACTVARYRVMQERRNMRRDHLLVFDDDLVEALAEDEEDVSCAAHESRRAALEHCLRKLREGDRDLIEARYSSPQELKRFAQESGRSRASLRVTLFRVRAALRRCVGQRLGMEGGGR